MKLKFVLCVIVCLSGVMTGHTEELDNDEATVLDCIALSYPDAITDDELDDAWYACGGDVMQDAREAALKSDGGQ